MLNPHSGATNSPPTAEETSRQPGTSDNTTINHLEETAQRLAQAHEDVHVSGRRRLRPGELRPTPGTNLLQRLEQQAEQLEEAHALLQAADDELAYSQAAEWLLDNYYIVQQAVRQVEEDLPPNYYRELPTLNSGAVYAGLPRAYAIARELLLLEQCQLDVGRLDRFLLAYQKVRPLMMGEIWALPILLRFSLLEALTQAIERVTSQSVGDEPHAALRFSITADDAETVGRCIIGLRLLAGHDWLDFFERVNLVEQVLRSDPARLYSRLEFQTRDMYRKIVEQLAKAIDGDEVQVARAAIRLATDNQQAAQPIAGWMGLELPRSSHVGYYLLDDGRLALEKQFGYRPDAKTRLQRWVFAHPTLVYVGSISLLTLLLVGLLVAYGLDSGGSLPQLLLILLISFIPATAAAVNLVNWLVTYLTKPRVLPKLDFEEGIPLSCRTMVVVPAMLTSPEEVESLLKQLEMHHLRNPDPHLSFALLTDLADIALEQGDEQTAGEQSLLKANDFTKVASTTPTEKKLIEQAAQGIEELNRRYARRPFYLFHRDRLWNSREEVWMGWERKRGKLHEFNRLLRGATDTTFSTQIGNLGRLRQIQYVITLDADTILPADAARRLVGTLAHPLNRAQFNAEGNKVVAGYTILQPRADIRPSSSNQSLFTRVFAGDVGLDLYSTAVSDVYQDLFCEGIYVGKGIYDVDAFERSLEGRIPENTLLSHDLLEGIYGRAALVTDIVLYEDYPPHYLVYVRRSHRWIRGDWQLLPWLLSLFPKGEGPRRDGRRLSLIDRWKITDNLRRSLLAPTLFLFFVAGWLLLPGSPLVWTLVGLSLPAVALLTSTAMAIARGIGSWREGLAWHELRRPVLDSALRWLLQIAFLPYEALLAADAILSTLWRMFVSRRYLLQWTTAAHTIRLIGKEVSAEASLRQMLPSLLLVIMVVILVVVQAIGNVGDVGDLGNGVEAMPTATALSVLVAAAPVVIVWLLSSWIAHWISRPDRVTLAQLSAAQQQQLRSLARRTWLFFEQYVGPDDNWLPPDHFQESPRGVVAHRTSPTNVGLYLLSALAAYDLGYVSVLNLALRLRSTFETLEKLDRYRGHFLNWINTNTLHPLPPAYVSTVDSGNLAGCLLALKQACQTIQEENIWRRQRWEGLLDMIALLQEMGVALREHPALSGNAAALDAVAALQEQLLHMREQIAQQAEDPASWGALAKQLAEQEQPELDRRLLQLVEAGLGTLPRHHLPSEVGGEAFDTGIVHNWRIYVERLRQNIQGIQREAELLFPWLLTIQQPPELLSSSGQPTAAAELWKSLKAELSRVPKLREIDNFSRTAEQQVQQLALLLEQGRLEIGDWETKRLEEVGDRPSSNLLVSQSLSLQYEEALQWCETLRTQLISARRMAETVIDSYVVLGQQAADYVAEMDFSFLYEPQRQVFHIGYNLESGRLDNNFYDLLASEARIASLVAIAKRDVPIKHWLHLARPLTRLEDGMALLSWSGTMFEYLMPPLLMRSYRGTLLEQSYRAVVSQHIAHGRKNSVPWGISESGFYTFDNAQNYQYRAFGVPDLGYKRGLGDDLVIAPYASMLAIAIRPDAVMHNLDDLRRHQMLGPYGLYEAIDFTPSRLELGQSAAIVRSYMSHHQGMILLALANYLQNERIVERFHAEPSIQSMELLLQEQVPASAPLEDIGDGQDALLARPDKPAITADPWPAPTGTPMPLVHYLSNGRLSSLLTNAGGGYLANGEVAYTRWRPDTTLDNWGLWLYIQDQEDGSVWSATAQPAAVPPQQQEVLFYPHMVRFRRRDHDITTEMEITVAPDDNIEIRRIHLTNETDRTRYLRLTSYGEVVLTDLNTDIRHPAFGKLFVESEYIPETNLLLFRRRPRSDEETPRYLGHMLVLEAAGEEEAEQAYTRAYETDRHRFLGRNHSSRRPQALYSDQWLTQTTGATLDSVMALGQEVRLRPRASVGLALVTIAADTRAETTRLAREYQRWARMSAAFDLARVQAEQELRRLNLPVADLDLSQRLLSLLLYPHAALRADRSVLAANEKGQSGLWAYGVSGDYPILLARISDESQAELLHFLLRAHQYWRRRGLQIDLVILNDQETSYGQPVQGFIYRTVQRLDSSQWLNRRGGIFVLYRDQIGREDATLLQTAARVILDGRAGSVSEQLATLYHYPPTLPSFLPILAPGDVAEGMPPLERPAGLQFDNGYGGFSADGREYIIYVEPGQAPTPAPWINVVANPEFGFIASESGGGFTWAGNSSENRLTAWRNDPVTDAPAEVFYLRDEETGEIWTPTPQPVAANAPYLVRHGAGYTIYEHHSHRLQQQLRLFVPPDAPVKIAQLRLENSSQRPRRITITFYAEWVLGTDRSVTQPYIIPTYNQEHHALLARNPYSLEFGPAVAFMATSKAPHGLTADRAEFLGRLGTLERPAALGRIGLNDRVHAELDTCAAMVIHLDLPPGGSEEVYFLLGQGRNERAALSTIKHFLDPAQVAAAWESSEQLWNDILGAVSVSTPDPAVDLLLNRWLLYQALSCRIWGRSALYQSGGAYGYRDQLQDVMSLLHTRPDLAREHLLRAARYQFDAGDVLHWWHPPSGRGVRTRITDDLAWLPYVVAHYVRTTADDAVLDEKAPYLTGRPLQADEEERYGHYEPSEESYTLYDHCCRALERASTVGRHGLPLMGAGDWNDGMNRVGIEGKGESVWLGWFLISALSDFAILCEQRGDKERAKSYRQKAEAYRRAIEQNAWDGEWYRRAYYDDGGPLGSRLNNECQIDAIAQSWGVLSGAADPQRARLAMESVKRLLVDEKDRLILLFTPPLDKTPQDPGYIKGYLPGIRENGGQYTHAALWTIWALTELGDGDEAEALYQLINPISRSDTREKADVYKVEPYVISADVYGVEPHEGRGGWTWYTGSSGWMYRLGIEGILGIERAGATLRLNPCIPRTWREYQISYRYGRSLYEITVKNPARVCEGVEQVSLDGEVLPENEIMLRDDGGRYRVEVVMGEQMKVVEEL